MKYKFINKDYLDKDELKKSNIWFKQNKRDILFLTSLFNWRREVKIDSKQLSTYLFNIIVLDSKYKELSVIPEWNIIDNNEIGGLTSKNKKLVFTFKKLFFESFKEKELDLMNSFFEFYIELLDYFDNRKKNYDKEFELQQKYSDFCYGLKTNKVINFNYIILKFNKIYYKNQKGFKI